MRQSWIALMIVSASAYWTDATASAGSNKMTAGATLISVQGAAAPTLTFNPASGTVVAGANITITPSGGQAGGNANYTCTPPAGVTVSNNNGSISTGGAGMTMAVSCPAGAPDGPMQCTHTGGAGSTPSPVNYTIDCPSLGVLISSTPATGTTLNCHGAPGTVIQTQVTIQNTGNANVTGLACNVSGAGFVLATPPSATIGPGLSSPVVVSCTVPASGTINGTLSCTTQIPAGGALSFPLSSAAQQGVASSTLAIVPASSFWSKLGLISALAALGVVAVAFRRHS